MNHLHRSFLLLVRLIVVAAMVATLSNAAPGTQAQDVGLTGAVTSMATGAPIAGARVRAGTQWTTTDAAGRYALALPAGSYHIRVEASGYIGMTARYRRVAEGGTTALDLEMIPSNPSPEEERVIAATLLAPTALSQAHIDIAPSSLELAAIGAAPETIRVLMTDGYAVTMTLDEYLKGVVPHEMPPSWPLEALKAQAVAARSYAATSRRHADANPEADADVCTTTHCQVWSPIHYDTTDRAVEATSGEVGIYGGSVIQAFFHAHCDGHTRNVEDVWKSAIPYLRGVSCPCGYDDLSGHGVGMCQWGARALATEGHDYRAILRHYYQGAEIIGPEAGRVTGGTVAPTTGDTSTVFAVEATYASGRDEPPAAAHAIIAGRSYALRRTSAGGASPQVFHLATRLPAGNHAVRLYFDDGRGTVSTYDLPTITVQSSGAAPGPSVGGTLTETVIVHSTPTDWAGGVADGVTIAGAPGDGALVLPAGRGSGVYTSPEITPSFTWVALGAWWHAQVPSGATIAWEVRTRADGAAWSAWQPLQVEEDDGRPRTTVGSELVVGEASAFQYRVTLQASSAGQSPVIENVSWVCLDTRAGADAVALHAASPQLHGQPAIISRAAWGADESLMKRAPEYRTPRAAIVHHTVTSTGGADPAAIVRAIYRYHAIHRDKGDIGYNFLVDHLGNVYEGRFGGPGVVGSHAGDYDYGSVGVAVIGDHQDTPIPSRAMDALVSTLAWQCSLYGINPLGQASLVNRVLPAIMGHRDCCATACPGAAAYAQLPELRHRVADAMTGGTPEIALLAPERGASVRGVVPVRVQATGLISRLELAVDGEVGEPLNVVPAAPSAVIHWNTTTVADGAHTLRVVATTLRGTCEISATVTVDNTPPTNVQASVPAWSRSARPRFTLRADGATAVQFSNGWTWEGEELRHQVGRIISDDAASGGRAVQASPEEVTDGNPRFWYGPYTCALPRGRSYEAAFRLRTPSRAIAQELARLDVVDSQGLREHAKRSLTGQDFAWGGAYEELAVPFDYPADRVTCLGAAEDGLEFRTWYRGVAELTLDRVTVWSAPQSMAPSVWWDVRPQDGHQVVTVRFLDAAGNATDVAVTVGIDTTPPTWASVQAASATVHDAGSGLNLASAAYALSTDGGRTWGAWQKLSLAGGSGTITTLQLQAPDPTGSVARFRIADNAGNISYSHGTRVVLPVAFRNGRR